MIEQRDGKITIAGVQVATIPENTSMLSVLGDIRAIGEDFRDDGYVYLDGKRQRRWITRRENLRVWLPHLKEIGRIERAMLKAKPRPRKPFWTWKKAVLEVMDRDGINEIADSKHRLTVRYPNEPGSLFLGVDRDVPTHPDGDRLHALYRLHDSRARQYTFLRWLFGEAASLVLPRVRISVLEVNGHTYSFERQSNEGVFGTATLLDELPTVRIP